MSQRTFGSTNKHRLLGTSFSLRHSICQYRGRPCTLSGVHGETRGQCRWADSPASDHESDTLSRPIRPFIRDNRDTSSRASPLPFLSRDSRGSRESGQATPCAARKAAGKPDPRFTADRCCGLRGLVLIAWRRLPWIVGSRVCVRISAGLVVSRGGRRRCLASRAKGCASLWRFRPGI